jgi:hypothetical protein
LAPATLPTISTTGLATSGFGTYPINAVGAADANYTISYAAGTLTVDKVPLLITADNKSKAYGAALPTLTISYTGLVNGDLASATLPTISTTGLATSNFGTYPITAIGAADANYTISYAAGSLEVTRRLITITADALSKDYGTTDPELTYQLTSGTIVPGDLPSGLLSRDAGESVGFYTINKNTLTFGSNYEETYVEDDFEIIRTIQTIPLLAGWNIISSFILPASPDNNMLTIFNQLITENKLRKVMDETGGAIEDWGVGFGWQNGITGGNILETEGYQVNVSSACILTVEGISVSLPLSIPLIKGWNIISFPASDSQDGEAVVQALIDDGKLVKVMDEQGNAIEDWGSGFGWQNGISNFTSGKGYLVNVNANCTLTITDMVNKTAIIVPELLASSHFVKAYTGNGVNHMNINVLDITRSGLRQGDEIGIFDGLVCVGAATIGADQLISGTMSIPVSANDGLSGTINGYTTGNQITLKLYSNGTESKLKTEVLNDGVERFNKGESLFLKVSTDGANVISDLIKTINVKFYPNPFTEQLSIEINSSGEQMIDLTIFDVLGRKVRSLYKGISEDNQIIRWDGANDQGIAVKPGIYYLRLNELMFNGIIKR